ncbi:MAG: ribosome biogenesis GTPase Der [Patescibacteria group bacterium]|jgi:GTP-binding protein
MPKTFPEVALIGRTNVGKSTLFNRLIGQPQALVSKQSGTTRDRNFGIVEWQGKKITLVDTGGLDLGYVPHGQLPRKMKLNQKLRGEDIIAKQVVKQAEVAIKQADLLIFVVDSQVGLQPEDKTITNILRRSGKPYVLVANKADKLSQRSEIWEFNKLGLSDPIPLSAANGSGTGDMLDEVFKKLKFKPGRKAAAVESEPIKIAIMGRPNVGKSSLLNSFLGEERAIVSPIAHTTREAQAGSFNYQGQDFVLVDTAGIRRHARIQPGLEKAGVNDSLSALKETDLALLLWETPERLTVQDAKIAEKIIAARCGLIVVANKWDLIGDKDTSVTQKFAKYFYNFFPALAWAPIIFVSAKTGQRVPKILELALAVKKEREKKISEPDLQRVLEHAIKKHLPVKASGFLYPQIYALKQIGIRPPRFELLIHPKAEIHPSYLKYLEKQIRLHWQFTGTPIILNSRFNKK